MSSLSGVKMGSPTAALLSVLLMLVAMELVHSAGTDVFSPDVETQEEHQETNQDTQPAIFQGQTMRKEDFKNEMLRQLMILQAAEESIMQKLREMETQRRALSNRKRSHYNSMCMFNVVACYRKKK